jgi:putative membrane protein
MKKFMLAVVCVSVICTLSVWPAFAQKTRNSTNTYAPASDRDFLKKAMEANTAEIELGKMAESKSQDPGVKEFATMMVKDHSDALNRLRQAASENNLSTSGVALSQQHQQLKNRLANLSGNEFDREYINAMVQDHQKDIKEFEAEANKTSANTSSREKPAPVGTEAQPSALARDLLPTLKKHLAQAQSLQQQMGKR